MANLMKFTYSSHLSLLFFSLLIFSIQSQPILSTNPSFYYNLCAPSRCNNLSLPYPFALPNSCYPSNYKPICPTNQSLLLTSPILTDTIRVLSLNYSDPTTATLLVASDSLFTCGAQLSRPDFRTEATIFSLPSNHTPGTHLNCTAPIPSDISIRGLQNASCLGCNGQDPNNICYYAPGFVSYPTICENYYIYTPGGPFNASGVRDLRAFLQSGYQIRYVKPAECRQCEISGGRCGSQPISGSFVCFCPSSVHRMNCSDGIQVDLSTWVNGPGGGGSGLSKAAIAGIAASASVLFLIIAAALVVILVRRRKKNIHFDKETISSISPTRYSYSQLKKLTNNFSVKLGEGGFGSVYKGTIHRSGAEVAVAVKMLKKSKQTQKQFMNEVATIGSVHHHNLVAMLGYCVDGRDHALVYEFMENGSLDKYIYKTKKDKNGVEDESKLDYKKLNPKQMYNIALETARGILYLHQGCRNRILHCNTPDF